jgi:hypothetical protein
MVSEEVGPGVVRFDQRSLGPPSRERATPRHLKPCQVRSSEVIISYLFVGREPRREVGLLTAIQTLGLSSGSFAVAPRAVRMAVAYGARGVALHSEVLAADSDDGVVLVLAEEPVELRLGRIVGRTHLSRSRRVIAKWDGMGWDGVGWDGMGWDGMGWDGMGWDGMGWDEARTSPSLQQRMRSRPESMLPTSRMYPSGSSDALASFGSPPAFPPSVPPSASVPEGTRSTLLGASIGGSSRFGAGRAATSSPAIGSASSPPAPSVGAYAAPRLLRGDGLSFARAGVRPLISESPSRGLSVTEERSGETHAVAASGLMIARPAESMLVMPGYSMPEPIHCTRAHTHARARARAGEQRRAW